MHSRWIPDGRYVTRAGSAWFFTVVVTLIVAMVVAGGLMEWSRRTPAVVLTALTIGQLGWAIFWRPRLTVTPEQIEVVNPWSTTRVPWSALIDVDTRFELGLVTRGRTVRVQAAPSPGGMRALRAAGRPNKEGSSWHHVGQRPGDEVSTDSGGAAAVIRGHLRELVEAGAFGPEEPVTGDWDVPVIAIAAGGAVLSLLSWLALLV